MQTDDRIDLFTEVLEIVMNKRRRILSVLMIVCLLISCSSVSTFAASGKYVKLQATQNYGDAQKVLKLINKQRSKRGLRKLKLDKGLTKSAAKRAVELTVYIPDTSPHRRPNGKLTKSINGKIIYECCAEGYETPKSVVSGWMSSSSHKKGILLSNARSVGIGCITSKSGEKYWTLEFSSSGARKKETRKKSVTSTYTVYAKEEYLKKKNFSISLMDQYYYDPYSLPTVYVGEKSKAAVFFQNKYGFNTPLKGSWFTWKSSKPAVAAIDKYGKITPKKAGTVTITAKMKGSLNYTFKTKFYVENYDDYYDDDDLY